MSFTISKVNIKLVMICLAMPFSSLVEIDMPKYTGLKQPDWGTYLRYTRSRHAPDLTYWSLDQNRKKSHLFVIQTILLTHWSYRSLASSHRYVPTAATTLVAVNFLLHLSIYLLVSLLLPLLIVFQGTGTNWHRGYLTTVSHYDIW